MKDADLNLLGVDAAWALRQAREALEETLDLLARDEQNLAAKGETVPYGRWLCDAHGMPLPSADAVRQRVIAVVLAGLERLLECEEVLEVRHARALAELASQSDEAIERTSMVRAFGRRATLVAPVLAFVLERRGLLGKLGAWGLSSHIGRAGARAERYGIHKEPEQPAVERLLHLDLLSGDAVVRVAHRELTTGTRDEYDIASPERRALAEKALREEGGTPPSTVAEHAAPLMDLLAEAHAVIARTRRGVNLPTIGVLTQLATGPKLRGAIQHWPGGDAALFEHAQRLRLPLLALAFDSLTLPRGESGLDDLVDRHRALSGSAVADELMQADGLLTMPGLAALPSAHLQALRGDAALGIDFTPGAETYVRLLDVLSLGRAGGPVTDVRMLLHQALEDGTVAPTLGWTTNLRLEDKPDFLHAAMRTASIGRRSLSLQPPLAKCRRRYHQAFPVHEIKASDPGTLRALRVSALLIDLLAVAVGRQSQALTR